MSSLRRPQSLDELRELLVARDLDPELADTARIAAALVEDPAGRSRIGGLPRLAEGVAWPTAIDGPIPHVASIRLEDLPAEVRPAADGELAIFVGADRWWADQHDSNFAVIHTPAAALGEPTPSPVFDVREDLEHQEQRRAAGDDPQPIWREQPLAPRVVVALPWEGGMPSPAIVTEHFDEDDVDGFEELAIELNELDPHGTERGHLVFGAPAERNHDDPGDGPVLIQLSSDLACGQHGDEAWLFGDLDLVALCGDAAAFRAGDFSSLEIDMMRG